MKLLRLIGGIVVFFWLLGLLLHLAGKLINLLLVVAVVVFLYDFFFNRK